MDVYGPADGSEVVLFADTFNRAYERENLEAALRVLVEGGYRVHLPKPDDNGRSLCCGRTYLSAGLVEDRVLVADLDQLRLLVDHQHRFGEQRSAAASLSDSAANVRFSRSLPRAT